MIELIGGIVMALGGSIPGVSGGTIALLMGFFDDMIDSVNAFLSKGNKDRKTALFFIIRLAIGYVIGLIAAIIIITSFFEKHIYEMCSLFIGITVFSVPLVIFEERRTLRGCPASALWIIPGAALVVSITLLSETGVFNSSSTFAQLALAFPCGILAACAMIMPGISGASIFMIFGVYDQIFSALHGVLHFDFSGAPLLISVGLGAVAGILGVVKGIKWLLSHKRRATLYAILGMMAGSVYPIWVGPEQLDNPQPRLAFGSFSIRGLSFGSFSVLFFLAGGLLIAVFEILKIVFTRRAAKKRSNGKAE